MWFQTWYGPSRCSSVKRGWSHGNTERVKVRGTKEYPGNRLRQCLIILDEAEMSFNQGLVSAHFIVVGELRDTVIEGRMCVVVTLKSM